MIHGGGARVAVSFTQVQGVCALWLTAGGREWSRWRLSLGANVGTKRLGFSHETSFLLSIATHVRHAQRNGGALETTQAHPRID